MKSFSSNIVAKKTILFSKKFVVVTKKSCNTVLFS